MARKPQTAIGLMSGTSMDGVDAALIETDGGAKVDFGPSLTLPYDDDFRAALAGCLDTAASLTRRDCRPAPLREVESELNRRHADAVKALLKQAGRSASGIGVIGFHGHTVLHRPQQGLTVQLGDGAWLAKETGIDVVSDFRAADVAAGGQGAPMVPAYHRALAGRLGLSGPLAFLNIGGVSNLTFIGGRGGVLAFDCGPGNALIDDWVRQNDHGDMDTGGALAAAGKVDRAKVAQWLANSYFARSPPKSLDRNEFATATRVELSLQDGAATLTALSAAAVHAALRHLPEAPGLWIVCGGGRRNPVIMAALSGILPGRVTAAEDHGLRGDDIEAQAFGFLAVRALQGLPITYPGTTGAKKPLSGGVIHRK